MDLDFLEVNEEFEKKVSKKGELSFGVGAFKRDNCAEAEGASH